MMQIEKGRVVRVAVALGAAVLFFVALALWRPVVAAAAVTVTTNADTTNLCATDGTSAPCSLRDAVTFANNHDNTTISIPPAVASPILLTQGTLTLSRTTGNTSINAAGQAVDGGCTFSGGICTTGGVTVFTVNSLVRMNITSLTIQHGNSATLGGGIVNNGFLTLFGVTIQNNTGFRGGGIYSAGDGGNPAFLTITLSTISGNTATSNTTSDGGGIENATGSTIINLSASTVSGNSARHGGGIGNEDTATISGSTISGNSATIPGGTGVGGGILNNGTLTITGSTISGNQATGTSGQGGGIYAAGSTLTMSDSTISGNSATTGGGIRQAAGTGTLTQVTVAANSTGIDGTSALTLANSILANTGANCTTGAPTDGKYNLISDATCGFADATDIIGANPQLLPLGSYGGTTQTQPPKVGSPALNKIPASGANCTASDQRGTGRPFGANCDMGAVEFSVAVSPFSGPPGGGTIVTLTGYGLVPGMTVAFGGSPCTGVIVNGAGTSATCATSAHAPGAVDLTLTANSQSASFSGLYNFIAPVTVTTSADTNNACATSGTGTCSLRDAVTFANSNDSTTILFSLPNPSTITLTQGTTLALTRTTGKGTTIIGPGAGALAVDGGCTVSGGVCTAGGVPVFSVDTGVTVSISGLTIQHGTVFLTGAAGGIVNHGTLTVTNCTLSGNVAFAGGAIAHLGGTLTVTNSTFSGNAASLLGGPTRGGGIYIDGNGTQATITNSTFTGNTATGVTSVGGGISANGGVVFIANSTFSGNAANGSGTSGGGIAISGAFVTITNSTFSGNSAGTSGGGIFLAGGAATLTNTIVANSPTGGDLGKTASAFSIDHSLIDDAATGMGLTDGANGNIVGHPAALGPLGSYGGTIGTQVIPLLPGSPAINAGDDSACAGIPNGVDQRGIVRPQGSHCDIGAFELAAPITLPGAKGPGGSPGAPPPLPASRPTGPTGGPVPNPLPPSRP